MLYAREVIDLLGAYPGRDFRCKEVVTYIRNGRPLSTAERHAIRKAVHRVMESLEAAGSIHIKPHKAARGGYASYCWKVRHEAPAFVLQSAA